MSLVIAVDEFNDQESEFATVTSEQTRVGTVVQI